MYQGKFDSKKKGASVDVHELVNQRNSAPAKKPAAPAPAPAKKQSALVQPPVKKAPAAPAQTRKPAAPAKKQPPVTREPVQRFEPQEVPEVRRGPRLGSVIFYTFYFMFILLFFAATYFGLNWLNGWVCRKAPDTL